MPEKKYDWLRVWGLETTSLGVSKRGGSVGFLLLHDPTVIMGAVSVKTTLVRNSKSTTDRGSFLVAC
jgi:hypothetical protein